MSITRVSAAALGVVALLLGGAIPASAEVANPRSSCAGLAISDHAVHDGPGAVAAIINDEVKPAAEAFGFTNSGQVVSGFAQVHAGTHVPGCEDAFFEVLVAGP
jgi:hypothetical protein